jgi:lysozyme family protein
MTTAFDAAFAAVLGHEGGFSDTPSDPGNWTGGAVGVGTLRGTKWGISAQAFPQLDIAALSQADAGAIYKTHYWDSVGADRMPAPLALLVFDAAVNAGAARAARWLQAALGVGQDGEIGPATLAALKAREADLAALMTEFMAQRIAFMAALPGWKLFGLGWARRLAALPFQAMAMPADPTNT